MKKIDRENIQDILALTPMQEGMLFHYLKDPQSDYYFEQLNLDITGEIYITYFQKALNFVVNTNEMMRTFFRWERIEKPVQFVLKEHIFVLKFYDMSDKKNRAKELLLEEIKIKDRREGFDLRQVPFRVILCKIEDSKYRVIISNHHILWDGWSTGIILKEFFAAYRALVKGSQLGKAPAKVPFKEFIKWQQKRDLDKEREYWQNYLKCLDPQTPLPIKQRQKASGGWGGEAYGFVLEKRIKDKLEIVLMETRTTLAVLLYCAWGILLRKYCSSDDVVFGTTVSGRSALKTGVEDTVGLFINTLPLRFTVHPGEKITDVLGRINQEFQLREAYQAAGLANIKEYSGLTANQELFDTIVVIENYPMDNLLTQVHGPLSVDFYSIFEMTHYDLSLGVTTAEEIGFNFCYNRDIFDRQAVVRLAHHFIAVIENLLNDPCKTLSSIEIISAEEKKRILVDFNSKGTVCSWADTIPQLFGEQVERIPGHIGLLGREHGAQSPENIHLSYWEIDKRSNQLAGVLKEKGVQAGTVVGIMLERSLEMVWGILGILKAGGAYLPIDPAYPGDRVRYMLADSGARILLTSQVFIEKTGRSGKAEARTSTNWQSDSLVIEETPFNPLAGAKYAVHQDHRHGKSARATDLAYIIYTSGSTGKPKGVMVAHTAVVNILSALHREYPFSESDVYLLKTSVVFDVSITELFGWFLGGGRLVILDKGGEKEPLRILAVIERDLVSHINFVPSMFQAFIEGLNAQNIHQLAYLRYIFLAGEALLPEVVEKFTRFGTGVLLENLYGPTEATVYASRYSLSGWRGSGTIPIGTPMPNLQLYILDRDNHIQPIGLPGELYICGAGLAQGYAANPELSAEKFIPTPILLPITYGRFYRTGDLARWLADGNIEFLGRIDHQVKIRGFRVELGEIENQLLKYQGIKEAVVTIKYDEGADRSLCAYIVPNPSVKLEVSQLKAFLRQKLPAYMVPTYFMFLDEIPLTATGKIDRKSLPEAKILSAQAYIAPRSKIEHQLVDIWCWVLGVEKQIVGVDNNFFELGGHSLKAVKLIAQVHKTFNQEVSLTRFFKTPTIRELARYIASIQRTDGIYREIKPVEEKEYYALSSAQKRQFILYEMDKTSLAYNMNAFLVLEGRIERKKLEESFVKLVNRHESFRTSFAVFFDEPVQKIYPGKDIEFSIEYYDMESTANGHGLMGNGQGAAPRGEALGSRAGVEGIIKDFIRPFDLSCPPLLRVGLIKQGDEVHILMIDMHHIIADGTSQAIIAQEFMSLYEGKVLSPLHLQYKDNSEWQISRQQREAVHRQEAYWVKRFEDGTPALNLPLDYMRPRVQSFEGETLNFEGDKEDVRALKAYALRHGTTVYMVLLALYNILLSKLCSQEDIVVGTPVAGRRHADLGMIVGMLVNTLVLRNYPVGDKTFNEFLGEITETTLTAFTNQEYQYEELMERLSVSRDIGRNPLFDTMFVLQNLDVPELEIPGLKLRPYNYENRTAKFDLTLIALEGEESLAFSFEYCTRLFKRETIKRFVQYFKNTLASVLDGPERRISEIEVITREEKRQILFDFNHEKPAYPTDKTLQQLFEEQVGQTPGHTAVVYRDGHYSYEEIDKRADRLARFLREKGIGVDTIVALMVERSPEMILGILSILKGRGAYLPINPKDPGKRARYMLDDSGARLLLASRSLARAIERMRSPELEVLFIDECGSEFIPVSFEDAHAGDLAYIIYTSGSTGNPKGVAIAHGNICPLLYWGYDLEIGTDDRVIQNLSYFFDWSVLEIFITLTSGASLNLADEDLVINPDACVDFIGQHVITVLHITPTQFQYFLNAEGKGNLKTLKYLFLGAEKLTYNLVRCSYDLLSVDCRVFNMYGPTEAAIISSTLELLRPNEWRYKELASVPIGKPVANAVLLVLDKHMKLCPVNVLGELYIMGIGVGRGYLNNQEKTISAFISSTPAFEGVEGRYMYKTGDLVRWLPEGDIEFSGRIDHQVKIRGHRIELGEIVNQLLVHERVKEAEVVVKEKGTGGEKYLCAYIVVDGELKVPGLKEHLSRRLPDHMIPSYFVKIDRLPLTSNGKIDWKTLPDPELGVREGGYAAPRNQLEEKLVEIWSELLALEKKIIGIDANFFELGGHSLKAASLISRINKEFSVNMLLVEIFKTPTIRGLATYIENKIPGGGYTPIRIEEKREYYDLSHPQKGVWFMSQLEGGSVTFNIAGAYILEEVLDEVSFNRVFTTLVGRHESLRAVLITVEGEPKQKILSVAESGFRLEKFDLRNMQSNEAKAWEIVYKEVNDPFCLTSGPLFKAKLVQLQNEKYVFLINMHHIISDAVSMEVILGEIITLYDGYKKGKENSLKPLRIQYKDFAYWQNQQLERVEFKEQQHYWLNQLGGRLQQLELPWDKERPQIMTYNGDSVNLLLDQSISEALKSLGRNNDATLFMVLVAVLNILFYKFTGQTDIILGTPIARREHADLEGQVGFYINPLTLRTRINPEDNPLDLLEKVKEMTLSAYEHQAYPFDKLVEDLGIKRDIRKHPIFNVMVDMVNINNIENILRQSGLKVTPYGQSLRKSKFDLTIYIFESEDHLDIDFDYNTDLFEPETISYMAECFKILVDNIIQNPLESVANLVIEEEPNLLAVRPITRRPD